MKRSGRSSAGKERMQALRELARIASVMVDGDVATRIMADRSAYYLAHPDPREPHLAGDYYDVDHAAFLLMKKTLLRLERLVDFPCNASLWVRLKGAPHRVTVVVQNGRLHRYYRFGEDARPLRGDLARCIRRGGIVSVPVRRGDSYLTVLAPVRNSLDEVVGAVELTAVHPANRNLFPAWS